MKLNRLKSTWQHFKIVNELDVISEDEIIQIIQRDKNIVRSLSISYYLQLCSYLAFLMLWVQAC